MRLSPSFFSAMFFHSHVFPPFSHLFTGFVWIKMGGLHAVHAVVSTIFVSRRFRLVRVSGARVGAGAACGSCGRCGACGCVAPGLASGLASGLGVGVGGGLGFWRAVCVAGGLVFWRVVLWTGVRLDRLDSSFCFGYAVF